MSATKFLHHDSKAVDMFEVENDRKVQKLDMEISKMRDKCVMDILRGGTILVFLSIGKKSS